MIPLKPMRRPSPPQQELSPETQHQLHGLTLKHTLRHRGSGQGVEEDILRYLEDMIQQPGVDRQDLQYIQIKELEELRQMASGLTTKRLVKNELQKRHRRRERDLVRNKPISYWKRVRYHVSLRFNKMMVMLFNIISKYELWHGSLRRIEGHFGSGVGTYFRFLRWLFLLNCVTSVLSVSFVMIPQILGRVYFNSTVKTAFPTKELNLTEDSDDDSIIPQFSPGVSWNSEPYSGDFTFGDLFTGAGWLNVTELYYGFFSSRILEVIHKKEYNIPHAYLFTWLICVLFSMTLLAYSAAVSYKKNYIETEGGVRCDIITKVLCAWDFNITDSHTAHLAKRNIHTDLVEHLDLLEKKEVVLTTGDKVREALRFLALKCVVICLIAGAGILLIMILMPHVLQPDVPPNLKDDERSGWFSVFHSSVFVTAAMLALPAFFTWLHQMEGEESPRLSVYHSLLRTCVLEGVVTGVLLYYFFTQPDKSECWENLLGQEMYRLIVLNFLLAVLLFALAQLIQKLLSRHWPRIPNPEFDVAGATRNLMYTQTLVWLSAFYCPLSSLVATIYLFCTFHIKKLSLFKLCDPCRKPWRAAGAMTVYKVLLFLSQLGAGGAIGFGIFKVRPSETCGPFKELLYVSEVFVCIMEGWEKEEKHVLLLLGHLTKPGVVAFIIALLSGLVWYLRGKALAASNLVVDLRQQITLVGQDKGYLLRLTENMLKGNRNRKSRSESRSSRPSQGSRSRSPRSPSDAVANTWHHLHNSRDSVVDEQDIIISKRTYRVLHNPSLALQSHYNPAFLGDDLYENRAKNTRPRRPPPPRGRHKPQRARSRLKGENGAEIEDYGSIRRKRSIPKQRHTRSASLCEITHTNRLQSE